MLTLDEILRKLTNHGDTLRDMGVRELAVFGSLARGAASQDSDLDFLVDLRRKTFDAYMDLKFFLEVLFGCPVDLVLKDTVKPGLRATIEESAVHAPGL